MRTAMSKWILVGSVAVLSSACGSSTSDPRKAGGTGGKTDKPDVDSGMVATGGGCKTKDVKDGTCKGMTSGVYALKTDIDVWWQDKRNQVDSGRGKITVYMRADVSEPCEDGSNAKTVIKPCGTTLPAFSVPLICGAFQIEFPDELWDKPSMPSYTTTSSVSGFNAGDLLSVAPITTLLGMDIADPEGAWPLPAETGTFPCKAGKGTDCFKDDDGDKQPGITIRMGKLGQEYSPDGCAGGKPIVYMGAPVDVTGALDPKSVRAEILYIGLRTRLGGSGEVSADCSAGVGDSSAENLDSRVIDCRLQTDEKCTVAQATYVDESAPAWNILKKGDKPPADVLMMSDMKPIDQTVSKGARSSMVRLGDSGGSFDCAAVRAADFAAL